MRIAIILAAGAVLIGTQGPLRWNSLAGQTVPSASGQAAIKPLRRAFRQGDEWRHRMRLLVRSELEGPETVKIGAVSYVKIVQHWAEAKLGWVAAERVTGVGPDGAAKISEQLENFGAPTLDRAPDPDDAQSAKLAASLAQMLSGWGRSHTLEYRVEANGKAGEIPAEGAPKLDESAPPLLTLWLLHALRPQSTLPERPLRAGESWQEPRRIHIAGWMGVHAGETGEWLEAPAGEHAALRLHVVQEISGQVLDNPAAAPRSREKDEVEGEVPPPASSKTERFYAESLSTIALDDGRVLASSRSARKEIVQQLPPVEGMPQPPRFRATLTVQVEMEGCLESQCEAGGNRR